MKKTESEYRKNSVKETIKEYYEKNKEFAWWLEKYIDAVNSPYEEAVF